MKISAWLRKLFSWGLLMMVLLVLFRLALPLVPSVRFDSYAAGGRRAEIPVLSPLPEDSLFNGGTVDELVELPGIGQTLASRIIESRERDGAFYFPEDLVNVKGIGEKRLADLLAYLARQETTATDLETP